MRIDSYEVKEGRVVAVYISDKRRNMKQFRYEQARPRGTWTEEFDENANPFFQRRWRCSACSDYNYYGRPDFCPCCGADMRKEGEEE